MDFQLDLFEHKIECFEALTVQDLEAKIGAQVEINKALMLEPFSVSHQATYHPQREKMIYTAVVHFKLKR